MGLKWAETRIAEKAPYWNGPPKTFICQFCVWYNGQFNCVQKVPLRIECYDKKECPYYLKGETCIHCGKTT